MVDVVGREVKVGDTVAYTTPHYHNLSIGTVLAVRTTSATVQGQIRKISRTSDQICKIDA